MAASEIRKAIARRVVESSGRWDRIGRYNIKQGNQDGHDSRRMARQLLAVASILRSELYGDILDDVFLRKIAKQSATAILFAIVDRFPGGRLPGFSEE